MKGRNWIEAKTQKTVPYNLSRNKLYHARPIRLLRVLNTLEAQVQAEDHVVLKSLLALVVQAECGFLELNAHLNNVE